MAIKDNKKNNILIAVLLAGFALVWYVVSIFTIW